MRKLLFVPLLFISGLALAEGDLVRLTDKSTVSISINDGPVNDAFGRLRVSEPLTKFDSKQIFDNQPLFWDDSQVSGKDTNSNHSTNTASTILSVSTSAGKRVRQTFRRFNYQPGKSQLILMTGVVGAGGVSGLTCRLGAFDDRNGLFFEAASNGLNFVIRSSTGGASETFDRSFNQSAWSIDKLDGTGPSGQTIDSTKNQIFVVDYEWLGTGRVRFGFIFEGQIVYAHEVFNENQIDQVYMATPNLPLRYEIENDGTAVSSSMTHICSTVISEGGQSKLGVIRSTSTGNSVVRAASSGQVYPVLGLRLKESASGATVEELAMSMIGTTVNDNFQWQLIHNPTLGGGVQWNDMTNSVVQVSTGSNLAAITDGTVLNSGYATSLTEVGINLINALLLGTSIAGVRDEVWITAMPVAGDTNLDILASLTWRELQ